MANEKFQALYGSFKRLRDFPLDPSCIFNSKAEMDSYINSKTTAYPGQVLVVLHNTEDENNTVVSNDRGIYYVIDTPLDTLTYVKALDVSDEEGFLSDFEALKNDFERMRDNLHTSLAGLYSKVQDEFVSIEEFEKITNFETDAVNEAIDSIGEIRLILTEFNTAIQHSKSFRSLLYNIKNIRKLIPTGILPNEYIDVDDPRVTNFNPTANQILVTTQQLNDTKRFVQHAEKTVSFKFGDGLENTSDVLSSDGFTISQIKIIVTHGATTAPVTDFNLMVSHSRVVLVGNNDIDFSKPLITDNPDDLEPVTFIYDLTAKVTQPTTITCEETTFNDATGIIYIKYFE